jgi:D-alanyl-D-alanine carboxypeptidase
MMRAIPHRSFCSLLLSTLAVTAAPAQTPAPACMPAPERQRAEARLQGMIDSIVRSTPSVPGVALTVLAPRQCLTWSGAAGVADRTTGAPLTANHPHRIASNTKTYTGAAILRLVEEGKLGLDDAITRHLAPDELASLRRDGYDVDRITVRHLLTHTAGLYDYAMDPRFVAIVQGKPAHRWTRSEQVDSAVAWGAPYGAPGALFHYTDTGYILLGRIVERLSGRELASAYRTLLHFDALGLRSTWLESLEPRPAGVPDLAHQYMEGRDTRHFDPSFDLFGGGGLAATTRDMARFTRALFVGGVFTRASTIDAMTTVPAGITGSRVYALGISRADLDGEVLWGHSGFWNTVSYHAPLRDVTIAASITEQGNRTAARAVMRGALAALGR